MSSTVGAVVGVLKFEVVGNQKVTQDMIVAIRWICGPWYVNVYVIYSLDTPDRCLDLPVPCL